MSGRFPRGAGIESSLPERLRAGGGTPGERRALNAAAREQPSRELRERMALAIGIAPPPPVPLEHVPSELGTLAPKAAVASRTLLPWISATAALAIAGAVVVTRSSTSPAPLPSVVQPTRSAAPISSAAVVPTQAPHSNTTEAPPTNQSASAIQRRRGPAAVADIQAEIALVDAARAALSSGASNRALELLRQYQSKYPAGSFRPEAAALKIEALVKLGRTAEARSLGERFVDDHRGSPLADRVSRLIGSNGR
ncbi:MAG: hypothetical protein ACOY0T_12800 [Myxococcota bacterium]